MEDKEQARDLGKAIKFYANRILSGVALIYGSIALAESAVLAIKSKSLRGFGEGFRKRFGEKNLIFPVVFGCASYEAMRQLPNDDTRACPEVEKCMASEQSETQLRKWTARENTRVQDSVSSRSTGLS